MTTYEAIKKLEQWQAEIIHGPMSFQGIIDVIKMQQALLNGVQSGHCDRRRFEFEDCDIAPCYFCQQVNELNGL